VAIVPQAMLDFREQSFGTGQVPGNQRDFYDGAEFEQVLLDQVLSAIAAAECRKQQQQAR
jgi:hypothetical protein